jgi:VWFA-related protein
MRVVGRGKYQMSSNSSRWFGARRTASERLGWVLLALLLPSGGSVVGQQPSQAPPPPAQSQPAQSQPASAQHADEITTKDAQATFVSKVNLVPVNVVVRDDKGRAIGNLTKEDFRLTDNGKPQFISRFSVESPATPIVLERETGDPDAPKPVEGAPVSIATRFVAYLFDDVHSKWEDLARARDAAMRQIATSLLATDRAAIYTTSGQTMLEFTDDQARIQETLLRLRPHPTAGGATSNFECPMISYYAADLLINRDDPEAWQTFIAETRTCASLDPQLIPDSVPRSMVQSAASRALSSGSHETRISLDVLGKVVRRISAMPGQRSIILASPGFLTLDGHQDVSDVISKAIRAKVIIGTLDARGLWTDPGFSAADPTPVGGPNVLVVNSRYSHFEAQAQEDVLAEIAASTGGTFIHNTNDLAGGFKRLAAAPEFVYVLGFTPTNLKSDGKFHSLKIVLKEPKSLNLQARRGYYAPKREAGAAEQARQDIEDALFSREVMKDFPVELHTQFFKPSDTEAKLSVLARVDIKHLKYRLEDGRYKNSLKVVTALFDPNGNYILANEKVIDFRLLEGTLEKRLNNGVTVKTTFDVKAGSYVVRLVVRDNEGQMMAAENGAVEIP